MANKSRQQTKTTLSSVSRNVDSESRKPRVQKSDKRRQPPVEPPSEDDTDSEIDELIDELDISDIDDSVRNPISQAQRRKTKVSAVKAKHKSGQQSATVSTARQEDQSGKEDFLGNENTSATSMVYIALHLPMHSLRTYEINTFIPNSAFMFNILHSMHEVVCENTYLYRTTPNYNTILSRLYYGTLFYVQVLRAKQAANNLTATESSFLRSFERTFSFESLPVAGPLVLYYRSLAAVKSDDPMYNWICPVLPTNFTPDLAANTLTSNTSNRRCLVPWIPGILDLYQKISTSNNIIQQANASSQFIPFVLANGGTFAGVTFPAGPAFPNQYADFIQLPGINMAPEQIPETLAQYQPFYRRMTHIPTVTAQTPLGSIREFLFMNQSMDWFSALRSIATEEAKFFHGTVKLSDIEPTTGVSTLVVGSMSNLPSTVARPTDWYPDLLGPHKAKYTTTRGGTSEMDFKVGITSSIILSMPNNHPSFGDVGSAANADLNGPYFTNTIVQHETPTEVTVLPQIEQVVRLHFYNSTGQQ